MSRSSTPDPEAPDLEAPTPRRLQLFSWKIIPLLVVTGVVVWFIIGQLAGFQDFEATLRAANPWWIAAAFGLMTVNLLLASFRLDLIIRATGFSPGFLRCAEAVFATWPVALLTPSRAGDFARAYLLRDVVPATEGSGAVLAEKVIDVQSLTILATAGSIIGGHYFFASITGAMLLGVWVTLFLLTRYTDFFVRLPLVRRLEETFRKLLAALRAMGSNRGWYLVISAISLCGWVLAIGIVMALLEGFHADVPVLATFGVWPIALFVGMLPVTLAGAGTRDAAFLSLLVLALGEVSESAVLAASLTYGLVTAWIPGILLVPVMLWAFARRA